MSNRTSALLGIIVRVAILQALLELFVKENEGFSKDTSERKEEHQTDLLSQVEMIEVETPDFDNMQN